MVLSDRCAAVLLILAAVGASACGSDRASAAAQAAEPPTIFERLGLPPSALPVRWVEAPDADGVVREYYEDILGYEGDQLDVAVRGLLVITQEGEPPTRTYSLTEYRLAGNGLAETTTSTGSFTVDVVDGARGPLTAYRLDGGASPDRARVFVRFDDDLHLVDPARLTEAEPSMMSSLDFAARTVKGRVEISDGLDELLSWKVRLRPGDELVARLDKRNRARAWEVQPETTGAQLRLAGSSEDGDFKVFTLEAAAPGWTDLTFDSGLPYTVRVKVE